VDVINDLDSLRVQPKSVLADSDKPKNELDRDAFLKIFLTQLESQDPLSPQDSADLSAQLAQFSQLEQSVNSTKVLGEIGAKLDELIGLTRGGGSLGIDPVSLLGRRIEFPEDTLTLPTTGTTTAGISAALPSGSSALVIQIVDPQSGQAGAFSLVREQPEPREVPDPNDPDGPPILITPPAPALTAGDYVLGFEDGQATLTAPDASGTIEFTRLSLVDGQLVPARGPSGESLPFTLAPGRTYRFSLQALDLSGQREPQTLVTTRSAIAESVRIVDGSARIIAAGSEIDPSKITRILEQTP